MRTILTYDQTFEGFLSCIFYTYEHNLTDVRIVGNNLNSENFFDRLFDIPSEEHKAKRVWKGISKSFSTTGKNNIYKAFLSELPDVENLLLYFIKRQFSTPSKIDKDFTDSKILKISKIVKMVNREKHRMDAFIRFRLTRDGIYFATIQPDFNVLPLNVTHFKNRYADQQWLIYDLQRDYGFLYNLEVVEMVRLSLSKNVNDHSKAGFYFSEDELAFQDLWKNYFNSTNIPSRKNMRVHLQHVPKRYWKYLSEKAPDIKN
jgi:probable DNA metabolism protein